MDWFEAKNYRKPPYFMGTSIVIMRMDDKWTIMDYN